MIRWSLLSFGLHCIVTNLFFSRLPVKYELIHNLTVSVSNHAEIHLTRTVPESSQNHANLKETLESFFFFLTPYFFSPARVLLPHPSLNMTGITYRIYYTKQEEHVDRYWLLLRTRYDIKQVYDRARDTWLHNDWFSPNSKKSFLTILSYVDAWSESRWATSSSCIYACVFDSYLIQKFGGDGYNKQHFSFTMKGFFYWSLDKREWPFLLKQWTVNNLIMIIICRSS